MVAACLLAFGFLHDSETAFDSFVGAISTRPQPFPSVSSAGVNEPVPVAEKSVECSRVEESTVSNNSHDHGAGRDADTAPEQVERADLGAVWIPKTGSTRIRTFYVSGEVESEFILFDGRRTGLTRTRYKSSRLKTEEQWVDGCRHGWFREYSESGITLAAGEYAKGMRNGGWTTWWDSGSKASQGGFHSDLMIGSWSFWTKDGQPDVERSGYYKAGKKTK